MERKTTKPSGSDSRSRRSSQLTRRYDSDNLQNARTLRREHTDAEGLLWDRLRGKGLRDHKFRRQQPIGPYIADFACMSESCSSNSTAAAMRSGKARIANAMNS